MERLQNEPTWTLTTSTSARRIARTSSRIVRDITYDTANTPRTLSASRETAEGELSSATHCNTLQHTTTHRNTPQRTATHLEYWALSARQRRAQWVGGLDLDHRITPQHTATHLEHWVLPTRQQRASWVHELDLVRFCSCLLPLPVVFARLLTGAELMRGRLWASMPHLASTTPTHTHTTQLHSQTHICVHVCTCVCVCMYVCVWVCVCVCAVTLGRMNVRWIVHKHATPVCVCECVCMCVCVCACVRVLVCVCKNVCAYLCVCAKMHCSVL